MEIPFIQDENGIESISGITYEFPYTMHHRNLSNDDIPWHWHEELEFNFAYKGPIIIETTHQIYTIQPGDGYFINTNVINTKRSANDDQAAIEYAHLFHPVLLTGHYRSIFETQYLNPILKNQSIEVLIFKQGEPYTKEYIDILNQLNELDQNEAFKIRNLLSEAWLIIMKKADNRPNELFNNSYPNEQAKKMLAFIHQNYAQKIYLDDLAELIGMSSREIIRIFKATFHQTPMEYLTSYRVKQAKTLLRETDLPITNIALMTGFNDSAYFSKIFKKANNLTPKAYRKNNALNQ